MTETDVPVYRQARHAANIRPESAASQMGAGCRGKNLDYCKRSTNRMLRRVWGIELDEAVSEGKTLMEMHASLTDESVHEQFKVWAESLFA